MSYNTRRTSERSPMTQVKYHQPPATRQASNIQSNNPGYSTQQPAYQTTPPQVGYSTTPAQPKVAQQPPLPSTPAASSQPQAPAQPKTPALKQEPPTPQDTPQMDVSTANGETTEPFGGLAGSKPVWKKKPYVKLPNKVKKARQNAKLRRILNPKNALMFLNELKSGIKFVVREEAGWGYVASVDIDGKSFSGHGLSMSKAKIAASEQALKHILLEKLTKTMEAPPPEIKESEKDEDDPMGEQEEGGEPKPKKAKMDFVEDEMPWGSLAAFALHKLFAEWQTPGGVEMTVPEAKYEEEPVVEEAYFTRRPGPPPDYGYAPRRLPPPGVYGRGRGFAPYPPRGPPPQFGGPGPRRPPPPAAFSKPRPAFALPGSAPLNMQPMKKIPEDATKRHPVMLLHQLKPSLVYQESQEGSLPNLVFKITVNIEGKEYVGKGKSKKEAKKNAAKEALAPMGIIYQDDQF